ncbi:MAG: CAP domain-containing protein [Chloroflexota bacterium]|nr:CAP domain-containing protein [Chloroflexota bacterium]
MFGLHLRPLPRSVAATTLAAALSLTTLAWQPVAASEVALQLPGDPAIATLISAEQALLVLTNADRSANGLAPLESDPETLSIARERAATQIDAPSLSHYNADGDLAFVKLLAGAQVRYALAGENLARAYNTDSGVTRRIELALMGSPMHRQNILEHTFNRVAIGAASDGNGQITFAEVYRD